MTTHRTSKHPIDDTQKNCTHKQHKRLQSDIHDQRRRKQGRQIAPNLPDLVLIWLAGSSKKHA